MRTTTRAWILAGTLLMAAAVSAGAKELPGSGFPPEKLNELQAFLDGLVAEKRVPSAIAMIARNGRVVWQGTAGEMSPGVPMRKDAIFPLASVGKMYTATAAMILVERGTIALEDPVSRYIPEFASVRVSPADTSGGAGTVSAATPITIRHLLTHTGGINSSGDAFWAIQEAHAGRTTTTEFARALAALPLQSQPGTKYSYGVTGASYEVLGAVIEIASGQTLEAFMTDNIFKPLGLGNTCFHLPPDKLKLLPALYRRNDGALTVARAAGEDFPRSTYFAGGGGVQASPNDILRFATLFLDGGVSHGVRILRPETVRMMMSDQLGALASFRDTTMSWGFGAAVRMTDRPSRSKALSQYGWMGGNYAILWVDPIHRLVGYFAFPILPPGDLALLLQFREMVSGGVSTAAQ